MNIAQAAEQMLAGKWVRRLRWYPSKQALFFDRDAMDGNVCGFRCADGSLGSHRGSASGLDWRLSMEDLLANDWEVVLYRDAGGEEHWSTLTLYAVNREEAP